MVLGDERGLLKTSALERAHPFGNIEIGGIEQGRYIYGAVAVFRSVEGIQPEVHVSRHLGSLVRELNRARQWANAGWRARTRGTDLDRRHNLGWCSVDAIENIHRLGASGASESKHHEDELCVRRLVS